MQRMERLLATEMGRKWGRVMRMINIGDKQMFWGADATPL